MFERYKEKKIFKDHKEIVFILFLITALLFLPTRFIKIAQSYYGIEYLGGSWNLNSFNSNFFNSGMSPSYSPFVSSFGMYNRFQTGYNPNFNSNYGSFNGYNGFSNSYNPNFGSNYGLFGRYNISMNPFSPGYGPNYGSLYPGYYGGSSFPAFGNFYRPGGFGSPFYFPYGSPNRPVSSDDPVSQPQNSLDPKPGDEDLIRGPVYLRGTQIYILESYPMQIKLEVTGDLPTPCHQLRATVSEPDNQNCIHVELYSLIDPDVICVQVLEPFEERLSLGSFTGGSYTVWINGKQVEEFTL